MMRRGTARLGVVVYMQRCHMGFSETLGLCVVDQSRDNKKDTDLEGAYVHDP